MVLQVKLMLFVTLVALTCCNEDSDFQTQVGEWDVVQTQEMLVDGDTTSFSISEYRLTLNADGSGERELQSGSITPVDWCLHNNNESIVLLLLFGQGSSINVSPIALNIEVNENDLQVWADRTNFINVQGQEIKAATILELLRNP